MKIKHLITLCVITIATISYGVCAAPIEELPTTVIQPSGQELDLYVSGDEFFNYLHDEDGNIIIKNYDNGYYYYAIIEDGNVVAGDTVVSSSEFEVMSSNSASIGSEYIKLEDR